MNLLDLFFPPRCPYCGRVTHRAAAACEECFSFFPEKSNKRSFYGETCCAPFLYDGMFRKAVIDFKFYNKPQYAKQLAAALADTVKKEYGGIAFDAVTCVPLSKKRKKERGYNQSELLSRELAKLLQLSFIKTLVKEKDNQAQHFLPKERRRGNVKGVYCFDSAQRVAGQTILLVDDIVTTGNTLHECCRVLIKNGAEKIYCAAVASVE